MTGWRRVDLCEPLRTVLGDERLGRLRDAVEGLDFVRAAALLVNGYAGGTARSQRGTTLLA